MDDDLWTSPPKENEDSRMNGAEESGPTGGKSYQRNGDSKYEKQESKEEALRNELESVRKVNEAIEGVIESLNKAKSSMSVSTVMICNWSVLTLSTVRQPDDQFGIYSSQHVDAHPIAD